MALHPGLAIDRCVCLPKTTRTSQTIVWHDVAGSNTTELDQLAERYQLRPLHVHECRSPGQRAKVDSEGRYLFIVLKILVLEPDSKLIVDNLDLFVGSDFLVTVHNTPVPIIETLRQAGTELGPDEVLFRLMDGVVDS